MTFQYIRYPAQNGGTVVSVGLQLPSIFTVTGSPVSGVGTFVATFNNEPANTVFAGPASGGPATPTFRALVAADLPAGTGTVTAVTASSPLFSSGGTAPNLTIQQATTSQNGYLSSVDWNTFNNKQPAGSYLTALTGDGTATGPGSVPFTLATVNANTGSFGTASSTSTFTVNGKGLITAASNTPIQIAESQVTNLVSDLAGKQPVGNYITALTGDVTATGPGSVAASLTATTNATITVLSALSLPGAQVTGNIAGNAANVTGTVTINHGGTGQTTQTAAFDALSPTTTKGDLIVNNGTNNVREPVGTDTFVLTADSTQPTGVKWASSTVTPPASEVWVSGSNAGAAGYGTTNTRIRRFLTTVETLGTDITYADDAANGGTFTINTTGVYSYFYNDRASGTSAYVGVTLNSAANGMASTSITSVTTPVNLGLDQTVSNQIGGIAGTKHLTAGDIITAQTDGTANDTADPDVMFRITRVA